MLFGCGLLSWLSDQGGSWRGPAQRLLPTWWSNDCSRHVQLWLTCWWVAWCIYFCALIESGRQVSGCLINIYAFPQKLGPYRWSWTEGQVVRDPWLGSVLIRGNVQTWRPSWCYIGGRLFGCPHSSQQHREKQWWLVGIPGQSKPCDREQNKIGQSIWDNQRQGHSSTDILCFLTTSTVEKSETLKM